VPAQHLVVNDLDRTIQVGNSKLRHQQAAALLDNAATGLFPEHYPITVPFDSPAVIHVRSSANDATDRLVMTGTDSADCYLLDLSNVAAADTSGLRVAPVAPALKPSRRRKSRPARASSRKAARHLHRPRECRDQQPRRRRRAGAAR
jgi:hypothetical protein